MKNIMTANTLDDRNGYALPNRVVMKAAQSHFNLIVADKTFVHLPAVQEKSLYLRDQLNADDQHLGEDIKRAIAALTNVGFNHILVRVDEILGNTTVAAAIRAEKIEELVKYCVRRVEAALLPLNTATEYLRQALPNLAGVRFADVGIDLDRIESAHLARLRQTQSVLTDDRTKLEQEKSDIDLQISQFNAPGWLEIFNKQIPSAEEIEAALKLVATRKPDREFLELVLKRLKGNLQGIEEGRLYANLSQAREGVRGRLEGVRQELATIEAQIGEQNSKLEKLEAIRGLDQITRNWLQEAEKIQSAFERFIRSSHPQQIQDASSIQNLAGRHKTMLDYLKSITWR
jgi:hypothetical protein